jgi:hypothetical protein
MSGSTPPRPSADRNLLFGILALQMDFISRDALITVMHAWVQEKGKPLEQILAEQGQLNLEHLSLLETLVQAHIRAHHDDPQQSLASLSSPSSVPHELARIADDDLQASLRSVDAVGDRAEFRAHELSPSQEARIDEVCDRFEAAWKMAGPLGQRPQIADYLGEPPQPGDSVLLCELAVLDVGYRRSPPSARRRNPGQQREDLQHL